jgi:uncharacterized protein
MSRAVPLVERLLIPGLAGLLEAAVEDPQDAVLPAAFMVVCHPHPQHGGTMDNKVVTTLARTAHALAVPTIRFNYRGVGASAGEFDDGRGETDDALAVVAYGRQRWPGAALWLAGFSFGGHVALRASTAPGLGKLDRLVTVAPSFARYYDSPRDVAVPHCPWLVVQGDADEVIDGKQVVDWAERVEPAPQLLVLPGVGHFFHGQLSALQAGVLSFLRDA